MDNSQNTAAAWSGNAITATGNNSNSQYSTIVGAVYHNKDVTAEVKALINNGRLQLNGDFNSYFGDPAPNVPKKLSIFYIKNGLATTEDFNESQLVDIMLDLYSTEPISTATYGTSSIFIDVTRTCNTLIQNNSLKLVGEGNFYNNHFADPSPGQVKRLKITYQGSQRERTVEFDENSQFELIFD